MRRRIKQKSALVPRADNQSLIPPPFPPTQIHLPKRGTLRFGYCHSKFRPLYKYYGIGTPARYLGANPHRQSP